MILVQHNDEIREANEQEVEVLHLFDAEDNLLEQAAAERDAARTSALTKLAALGITDTEINALLGS